MPRRARHLREEPGRKRRSAWSPSLVAARGIAWRAVAAGSRLRSRGSLVETDWNIAPHCGRPYERRMFASSRGRLATPGQRKRALSAVSVTVHTPCRRCTACLEHRRRLWSARARSEASGAPETWFGTLTFRPELHQHWLECCRRDARLEGVDFDQLTLGTQFACRLRYAGREAGKYIRRLREVLPAPVVGDERLPNLRYLLIAEKHQLSGDDDCGRPHFHVLLHGIHAAYPVPLEVFPGLPPLEPGIAPGHGSPTWPGVLEREWEACGFSKFKRVTERNASYLCKYLSKDADNRVRASLQYGAFDYTAVNALAHNVFSKT